jgi:hypothetical protein
VGKAREGEENKTEKSILADIVFQRSHRTIAERRENYTREKEKGN